MGSHEIDHVLVFGEPHCQLVWRLSKEPRGVQLAQTCLEIVDRLTVERSEAVETRNRDNWLNREGCHRRTLMMTSSARL